MHTPSIALISFFYGLAFFSMGLAITLEMGRGSDTGLKHALRPLAGFGLLHGMHEWLELFEGLHLLPGGDAAGLAWTSFRLAILAFSFLSLGAFGASLLSGSEAARRVSMLAPLGLASLWGFGLLVLRGKYPIDSGLFLVAEAWTRYSLAIPSGLLAAYGLVVQQRRFRQAGMAQFGRDSLWAAVAFAWYGVLGQGFPRASALPPSNFLNQDLFLQWFGFPVQLLRGLAAVAASVFVIRFLRSFEVEVRRQIASLQAARLQEAEQSQDLRGQLLKRVVMAQEAERQRIARELHDETGQALTAIGLGLRGVASTLRQDANGASLHLRELEGLVDRSLNELQRLISDLRPSHLDDLGLPATLRWYAKEIQSRLPLDVAVEVSGEPKGMGTEVATTLFRVAQEALTNVVKHARAKRALVRLVYQPDVVCLAVEDDGIGFEPGRSDDGWRKNWGLLGMKERAALLGGQLWLNSSPGRGALVEVTIPYGRTAEVEGGGNGEIAAG